MNDALPANAVWTWTWTGGPLAGTVQPLIGSHIELCADRDNQSPQIKLWHTPAGFVVQITGKKVMRDGVCADVHLLQPGDCLRTKEFAAVIDWSPNEEDSAGIAPPRSVEADHSADDSGLEVNSNDEPAANDKLAEASAELEQPLSARPPESVEVSPSRDDSHSNNRDGQGTRPTHFQDALQALDSVKRQLLAAPQGISSAVFESLDDIARRLDSTAELIKELAVNAEKAAWDALAPAAQAEQNDFPDQLKTILKRLEVESVDISDLVQLKASKSISDIDLLKINTLNLVITPPAATEHPVEISTEAPSQPTPVVDTNGDSLNTPAEHMATRNNQECPETPATAELEHTDLMPELQQSGAFEAWAAEESAYPSRTSDVVDSPSAEPHSETTHGPTSGAFDFEQLPSEMDSAINSPADELDSVPANFGVDVSDDSRDDLGPPRDYLGSSTTRVEDFAYGLSDASYPNDFAAPLEPANDHYPADIDPFRHDDLGLHSSQPGDGLESGPKDRLEIALANLTIISKAGPETAEENFMEQHGTLQGFESVDAVPSSTEQICGLSTTSYLSSILQEKSQEEQPPAEEPPIVDESTVANFMTNEHDSDDGINDYMNQLFSRLRGGKAPIPSPASPAKKKEVEEPAFAEVPLENNQPLVPLKEEEFVPQKSAPELQKDMNAMRRLANESTRAALSTFNEQRQKAMANARIGAMFGLIGFSATMLLVSRAWGDIFNLVGISALIAAAGTGLWHFFELKKLKQLEQQTELTAPMANSENN